MSAQQGTRRDFLKTAAGTMGAGVLATSGLTGLTAGAPAEAATTLQLYNDKVTWTAWMNSIGKAAQSAIGVGWKAVPYADTTTYQAAIRTSGRTNKAPDLFTWWSGWLMTDVIGAGIPADLSSLWDKYKSVYSPGLRSAFSAKGKTYGVPLYLSYWVVFYNKHVFSRYGLTPPTTWAQFAAINTTLRSKGITPLIATDNGRWPTFIYFEEMVARSAPGLYNDLVNGKVKYTDPRIVKAMNLWGEMIKQGDFTDPAAWQVGTAGTNNAIKPFGEGKFAMIEMGSWFEPTLNAAGLKPDVDYGMFIMPNINPAVGNVVIFESGPLCVGAHGPNEAEGLKVADYFMSKAGQQEWINITGFIPPRSDVAVSSSLDRKLVSTLNRGNYTLLQRYWEATPHDIVEFAIDQFDKFMLQRTSATSALQAIQKQADQSWAALK